MVPEAITVPHIEFNEYYDKTLLGNFTDFSYSFKSPHQHLLEVKALHSSGICNKDLSAFPLSTSVLRNPITHIFLSTLDWKLAQNKPKMKFWKSEICFKVQRNKMFYLNMIKLHDFKYITHKSLRPYLQRAKLYVNPWTIIVLPKIFKRQKHQNVN